MELGLNCARTMINILQRCMGMIIHKAVDPIEGFTDHWNARGLARFSVDRVSTPCLSLSYVLTAQTRAAMRMRQADE